MVMPDCTLSSGPMPVGKQIVKSLHEEKNCCVLKTLPGIVTLLGCSTLLVPTNPSIAASPDKFKHYSASLLQILQILQRYQLKKTSLFWPKCSARHSPKLPYSSSWPGGNVFRLYLSLILSPGLFLKTSTKVLFSSLNEQMYLLQNLTV